MITHQSKPRSIAAIKTANRRSRAPYFFSPQTMRVFRTYLPSQTWQGKGSSTLFITADAEGPDDNAKHVYTIRRSLYTGEIDTVGRVGGFGAFAKLYEAKQAAAELSESEREQW